MPDLPGDLERPKAKKVSCKDLFVATRMALAFQKRASHQRFLAHSKERKTLEAPKPAIVVDLTKYRSEVECSI